MFGRPEPRDWPGPDWAGCRSVGRGPGPSDILGPRHLHARATRIGRRFEGQRLLAPGTSRIGFPTTKFEGRDQRVGGILVNVRIRALLCRRMRVPKGPIGRFRTKILRPHCGPGDRQGKSCITKSKSKKLVRFFPLRGSGGIACPRRARGGDSAGHIASFPRPMRPQGSRPPEESR